MTRSVIRRSRRPACHEASVSQATDRHPARIRARRLVCFVRLAILSPAFSGDTVIATVPIGRTPYALSVNPVTHKVYVANYNGRSVSMIDGSTNTHEATVAAADCRRRTRASSDRGHGRLVLGDAPRLRHHLLDAARLLDRRGLPLARGFDRRRLPSRERPQGARAGPDRHAAEALRGGLGSANVSVYNATTLVAALDRARRAEPRALGVFSAPGHRRVFVANRAAGR